MQPILVRGTLRVLLAVILLPLVLMAQTELRFHQATSSGTGHGSSLAGLGDVDGDGHDDYAVGSRGDASGAGVVRVFSGRTGLQLWSVTGDTGNALGTAVANVGDFDGDGIDDVGAGGPWGTDSGVRVLAGSTGTQLYRQIASRVGTAIASMGDLDGDGRDEFVVGSSYYNGSRGRVTIHAGGTGAVLFTLDGRNSQEEFGLSVDGAGDVDGDGVGDVVIGTSYDIQTGDRGRVECYSGATGIRLWFLQGTQSGYRLGAAVAGLGDIDGDGRAEVAAGEPGIDNDSGRVVFIDDDGSILTTIDGGVAQAEEFGATLLNAGDIDGDGRDDLLVGAPEFQMPQGAPALGRALVFGGGTCQVLTEVRGTVANERRGAALGGRLDVDRDGLGEFLVGAPLLSGGTVSLYGNAAFRGSGEDLQLLSGHPGRENPADLMAIDGMPTLSVRTTTKGGTHLGRVLYLTAHLYAEANPPQSLPGFPQVHVSADLLDPTFLLLTGIPGAPFGSPTLGGSGIGFQVPNIDALPAGLHLRVQSFVIDASGALVATNAHEFFLGGPRQLTAIYVAPDGRVGNPGTASAPLDSITDALRLARVCNASIRVATGTYSEELTIDFPVDMQGGLDRNTWLPGGGPTIVEGDETGTTFIDIAGAMEVRDFQFRGDDDYPQFSSIDRSYSTGIRVVNCNGTPFFFDCTFVGRDGRDLAFFTNGAHGARGLDGLPGDGGDNLWHDGGFGSGGGGRGGSNYGRAGGWSGSLPKDGSRGTGAGGSVSGGTAGSSVTCATSAGGGGRGSNGANGLPGAGGLQGQPQHHGGTIGGDWYWRPGAASDGGRGQDGQSGGGGGGGGGQEVYGTQCDTVYGGSGGGGGGIGFGGEGGSGGLNGGGSFGALLVNASPAFEDCTFVTGHGGRGGLGGHGGRGGAGGNGGAGGAESVRGLFNQTSGRGGNGGPGGNGGGGGGGAGGHGGPCYGVVLIGNSSPGGITSSGFVGGSGNSAVLGTPGAGSLGGRVGVSGARAPAGSAGVADAVVVF